MKVSREEGGTLISVVSSGMWKTRAETRRSCRKIGREESGKTRA